MWPDTGAVLPQSLVGTEGGELPRNMVQQGSGEAEMDFSLGHFLTHLNGLQYGQVPVQEGGVMIPQDEFQRPAQEWDPSMFAEPGSVSVGYHHTWPTGHV